MSIRIQPRSGDSLRAPGFSRGIWERELTHERRRRESCRAYGAFIRFVLEFPRLKPGAGRMSPLRGCIALFALCFVLSAPAARAQPVNVIVQIDLDDVIHPVSADYVKQGLQHAKQIGARAAIIRINTPGGLVDSMREIVEAILSSQVPVITWVGPNGSRAASAGFFILLAADVTLMAPGTNTGAAHPVSITGSKIDDVMEKKIVSDASAYLRSYVAKRGRNAALAEKGVSESQSFTAEEAL